MTRMRLFPLVLSIVLFLPLAVVVGQAPTEAPPGWRIVGGHTEMDTNGFLSQADFEAARTKFDSLDADTAAGLGPVFNARTCGECHQNPNVGGISETSELRCGHFNGTSFSECPGGSLINQRATRPGFQERVPENAFEVRTLRMSLNTIGDGFVEAIDSNDLFDLSRSNGGQFIEVPVAEAGGLVRGGRFGWKNQNASLLTFSGDAYLNEQGITNRLFPVDNTSMGRVVDDQAPDPEDADDIDAFTDFMRSTGVPPRDTTRAATPQAQNGDARFTTIGCDRCHVRNFTTLPAGTVINRGQFTVPAALGNKRIHPFGDFLLHDVGTGDGIVQNGPANTRNKVRTAPLWGVRTHPQLMHDGVSLTFTQAILRHSNEALGAANAFRNLTATQKDELIAFLNSL